MAHHIAPEQLKSPEQALKTDTAFFDVKKSTHAVVLSDHAQFEEEGNLALEAADPGAPPEDQMEQTRDDVNKVCQLR